MPTTDRLSRRSALVALLATAALPAARAQDAPAIVSRVRFATIDEGRALITADDDWVQATSDFQRAAITGLASPVSRERLRAFLAETVLPWPPAEEAHWQSVVAATLTRMLALRVPLPPEIVLVNTDGRDSAGAAYTRGKAIFLPSRAVDRPAGLPRESFLFPHEVFHVVSRREATLANRLYALIGFEPVEPLRWPEAWLPGRIANPDAPLDRHAMRLPIEGREAWVMPLLVARRTELQPGESFFSVMDLRLLEVTVEPGRPTLPVLRDGAPLWHSPRQLPGYGERLGGNTGYIIHPDEAMADNIALLVTGEKAKNPALLARIEAVLAAP